MSRALSLAGFQVTIIGRFWVTAEDPLYSVRGVMVDRLRGEEAPVVRRRRDRFIRHGYLERALDTKPHE